MSRKKDFKNWSAIRIFASYYIPHIKIFILDMVCALLISGIDLVFPYVSKLSMQKFLPESMFKTFYTVMAICFVAYILRSVMYYIITYWGHMMGARIEADIRSDVFAHIQKLSFGFFDRNRTGILMSRVTTDLFDITELAHHGPEDFVVSVITILGSFIIMCTMNWRLAVLTCMIIPVFAIFTIIQRKRMSAASLRVKGRTAEINAAIESGLSGMRTAKAFANEDSEQDKFETANLNYKTAKKDYYSTMGVFHGGMEFAMSILSVIVVAAGGFFIMRGELSYLELLTFSLYVSTFITPIRKLSNFVEQFLQGMAGFTRFLELMRTDAEITDAPDAQEMGVVSGDIQFRDVSFSYDGSAEVLRDIDLEIKPGQCLAVVGPSGGGKTTLCQLIPRFYEVTSGAVLVDGKDVRTVTQQSLRSQIGIVQQDVFLFAGTIMENIRYGRPDATDSEVAEAAVRAEIHDEIMQMPDGYMTYVGERGIMLSGGQKQRISIARIFLKNPPILILDEATSALDSVTEAKIQQSFDELCKGRTSIIIAHRLSTIRNADKIAVIDGGSIQELGTHRELMEKGGEYARLVETQSFADKKEQ
jgi:ATP-binding cassette subfamily B protein